MNDIADELSRCADALHERLLSDIAAGRLALGPARDLFEQEVLLRERANSLYADGATQILPGLGQSGAHLLALTAEAKEKIRKVTVLADALELTGGLVALAGALATGQAGAIVKAGEKVLHAGQVLHTDSK